MRVRERIQYYRKTKGLSQEYISSKLGLEQSQYSRRETGVINFDAVELSKLAEILEVDISEFFEGSTFVVNSSNQSGGSFGQYVTIPDKLIELYEARLREKDEVIDLLKAQLKGRGTT
jgi:transcriptional regulator with XRE-family HTH domain